MASEQMNVTHPEPSKPKKMKSKPKKTKSSKPKPTKRSKPSQLKKKKVATIAKQQRMNSVTDDLVYAWDGGTMLKQQHHPTKRARNKQSTAAADQGSSTASCVQCFDTDQL